MSKQYYVYMMSNRKNGTLYVGVTSDIEKRVWEHKNKVIKGFTEKYNLQNLVYFEIFNDPYNAIKREKRLKFYLRKWKIDLIEKENPNWLDLYKDFYRSFGQAEG
ncbi:MAG: GIY-YIG nuclease family protein [Alphaproteobacteria bacterium]|nr:GIY-YIG nuclease family protein [Alphaproteobacteria bacterium]